MVFYRKYRPQTIEELDSSSVRETFTSVLSSDLPHAFLFTGPKGLGKTSTARIVAKAVNCTTPKNKRTNSVEPCNTCDQCVSITNGTNMDVIEMDAASNRGIDEVRELKETIKLAPLLGKKKIYIIDEVHMLTTEAFNALLKTLEEPPDHTVFILCTTELHKVPSTILSRCFHVGFKLATKEELVRSFKRIVTGEKIQIDDDALSTLAQLSDGGFRDGAKMLEELSSLSEGKKITAEFIEKQYHLTNIQTIKSDVLSAFATRNAKKGIQALSMAEEGGVDSRYLLSLLLDEFHKALLQKAEVDAGEVHPEVAKLNDGELLRVIQLLSDAYSDVKYAFIPQLPLELSLLQWTGIHDGIDDSSEDRKKEVVVEGVNIKSLRKQVGNIAKMQAINGSKDTVEKKAAIPTSGVSILHFSAKGDITPEYLAEFWGSLLDTLKTEYHTTAGVLRGCVIKSFDRKTLIIQTPYKFHKERLDEPKTKAVIEKVCKELTGNPIEVTVELKSGK